MKLRKKKKKNQNQNQLVQQNLMFFLRSEIHCKNKNSTRTLQFKRKRRKLFTAFRPRKSRIKTCQMRSHQAGFLYLQSPSCSFSFSSIIKDQIFNCKTDQIFHSQYICDYFVVYYIVSSIKHTNHACEFTIKFREICS